MKKAVIFDMDGVLIDSEPLYVNSFRKFLEENHVPISTEQLHQIPGASSAQIWRMLSHLWPSPMEPSKVRELYYNTQPAVQLPFAEIIFPNVRQVLATLTKRGFQLALASSSRMHVIHQMLAETCTAQFFSYITSGEMFQESKPNPEIYLHLLQQMNLSPQECVVIEDSPYGIQAAKSAQIETIAIRDTRYHFNQSLADAIIDDIKELLEYLPLIASSPNDTLHPIR